jgi:glyoxylase-like metal-dependent hydrolase (beta-lactamase superfamily II)
LLTGIVVLAQPAVGPSTSLSGFSQPAPESWPDLFLWTDTCNVYVLRDGDAALLVDLGDGSILDHLARIGVKRVEWVLFTHHHREQCQGAPRLKGTGARLAAPEAERAFFERPTEFRKLDVRLDDPFTVYGASAPWRPTRSLPGPERRSSASPHPATARERWLI